jgi:hypothetical protein
LDLIAIANNGINPGKLRSSNQSFAFSTNLGLGETIEMTTLRMVTSSNDFI